MKKFIVKIGALSTELSAPSSLDAMLIAMDRYPGAPSIVVIPCQS